MRVLRAPQLNGRPAQPLIDPTIDLSTQPPMGLSSPSLDPAIGRRGTRKPSIAETWPMPGTSQSAPKQWCFSSRIGNADAMW